MKQEFIVRTCPECGQSFGRKFVTGNRAQRFCCEKCNAAFYYQVRKKMPAYLSQVEEDPAAKTHFTITETSGKVVFDSLGFLRREIAKRMGLLDDSQYNLLWVVDFPLFEKDDETGELHAMHHPFTSPKPEDVQYLDSDPGKVRANAYDLAMNGVELGGGSIRIHDSELQNKMFELLGFTPEKAMDQFGCIINAFKYGAPPHGGLAFGLDRLVSMLAGLDSIRDVIAFPKNNSGRDVMIDSPSAIDSVQLEELGLNIVPKKD